MNASPAPDSLSRVRERAGVRARELRTNATEAERHLWQRLRNRQLGGWKFRRQHPVGPCVADFACVEAQLIVELDGGQHFEPEAAQRDERRTSVLEAHGFSVLRFDNRQALTETDAVLTAILDWLNSKHPHLQCAPRLASRGRSAGSPHAARNPRLTPDPLPPAGEGENPRTST